MSTKAAPALPKPLAGLKVGDWVLISNPKSGMQSFRKVTSAGVQTFSCGSRARMYDYDGRRIGPYSGRGEAVRRATEEELRTAKLITEAFDSTGEIKVTDVKAHEGGPTRKELLDTVLQIQKLVRDVQCHPDARNWVSCIQAHCAKVLGDDRGPEYNGGCVPFATADELNEMLDRSSSTKIAGIVVRELIGGNWCVGLALTGDVKSWLLFSGLSREQAEHKAMQFASATGLAFHIEKPKSA